jgi:hypothetical protein
MIGRPCRKLRRTHLHFHGESGTENPHDARKMGKRDAMAVTVHGGTGSDRCKIIWQLVPCQYAVRAQNIDVLVSLWHAGQL